MMAAQLLQIGGVWTHQIMPYSRTNENMFYTGDGTQSLEEHNMLPQIDRK
jgi:hypothetical protein